MNPSAYANALGQYGEPATVYQKMAGHKWWNSSEEMPPPAVKTGREISRKLYFLCFCRSPTPPLLDAWRSKRTFLVSHARNSFHISMTPPHSSLLKTSSFP